LHFQDGLRNLKDDERRPVDAPPSSRCERGLMTHRRIRCMLVLLAWSPFLRPSSAHAERLQQLVLGSELRVRPSEGWFSQPRYELVLSHGLSSAHADLLVRIGMVLPGGQGGNAFPGTLGMRWTPLDFCVRPLLGVELGGYFSQSRGQRAQGAPDGLDWTWSTRALAGAEWRVGSRLALRLYADAAWAEMPAAVATRDDVFSGLGAGAELIFRWAPPRWKLVDMVVRGDDAPTGW
jgi:hypothetical protein